MTKRLGDRQYRQPAVKKNEPEEGTWAASAGKYLSMTSQNVSPIAFFGILGWYCDDKFDTKPFLMAAGILVGAILGFYNLIRSLKL